MNTRWTVLGWWKFWFVGYFLERAKHCAVCSVEMLLQWWIKLQNGPSWEIQMEVGWGRQKLVPHIAFVTSMKRTILYAALSFPKNLVNNLLKRTNLHSVLSPRLSDSKRIDGFVWFMTEISVSWSLVNYSCSQCSFKPCWPRLRFYQILGWNMNRPVSRGSGESPACNCFHLYLQNALYDRVEGASIARKWQRQEETVCVEG